MRRRLLKIALWVLGAAALLGGAAALLEAWLVPAGIRAAAARALRDASGEATRIGEVHASLWRGQVRLLGVEARGLALGGLGVDLTVDEVRLQVARRDLLRGRLRVRRVTLDSPALALRAGAAPAGRSGGALAAPLGAQHLVVRAGRVSYEDRGLGLRLEAGDVEGEAAARPDGIGASLRVARVRVAAAGRTASLGPGAAAGVVRPDGVAVDSLQLEGLDSSLSARGQVRWPHGRPVWDLAVEARLDGAQAARLMGAPGGAPGRLALVGTVQGTGSEATFRGEARAGAIGAHAVLDRRQVRFLDAPLPLWGGTLRAAGNCAWAFFRCQLRGQAEGIDLAQVVPGGLLGGRGSAAVTFEGTPGRPETYRVAVSLRASDAVAAGTPLGALALEGHLEGSRVEAEGSAYHGRAPFRLAGWWGPDLALDVAVGPVGAQHLGLALGRAAPLGALRAEGRFTGPWSDAVFRGRIVWDRPGGGSPPWGVAEGAAHLASGQVAVALATFRQGDTALRLRGTARPAPGAAWPGAGPLLLDLAGEGEGAVEDLMRAAGIQGPVGGHFTMRLRVRGPWRRPEGDAQLLLRELRLGATRWHRGEARLRLVGGGARLDSALLIQGAARLEARGEVAEDGSLALDVAGAGLDLGALAGAPSTLGGTLSGTGRLTGTAGDPVLDATVQLAGVTWEKVVLGDLRGRVTHARDRAEAGLRSPDGRLTIAATIHGGVGGRAEGAVTAQEVDVTPLLALAEDRRLAAGRARAGGTATFSVMADRPREIQGEATLTTLEIALAGESWRAEGPVRIRFASGAIQVAPAVLRGRLGTLRVGGTLRPDGHGQWTVEGPVSLATAALWIEGAEGSGAVIVDLAGASSPGAGLRARGGGRLAAERLRVAGLPWTLEAVDCPWTLEGPVTALEGCRAAVAGGTLTGSGSVRRLGRDRWVHHWRLHLEGARAERLAAGPGAPATPLTGTAEGSADVTFLAGEGTDPLQTLKGTVQLRLQDGWFYRATLLSRILEVVNLSPLRRWRLPDLSGPGMPYRRAAATAQVERGIAEVREVTIDSDAMRLAGAGSLDLGTRKVRLALALRPLTLLDDVIGSVPVVGAVIGGRDGGVVTLGVDVSGTLGDPIVRLAGARTLGRGLLERLRNLLEGMGERP